ncbi:MAG: hypothetical protein WCV91_07180, partial [Candidatus Margulisiibacteriota bacterium]
MKMHKSGNISVGGRILSPTEYRLVAPFLGKPLPQRIKQATGLSSVQEYKSQLSSRKTKPLAYFVLNTPCNRACQFCFFQTDESPSLDIDWSSVEKRVLLAQAKGYQTKIYPKETNATDTVLEHAAQLMRQAKETFIISNNERPLAETQFQALAAAGIRHIAISSMPREKFVASFGHDSYEQVFMNTQALIGFSRRFDPRPFT